MAKSASILGIGLFERPDDLKQRVGQINSAVKNHAKWRKEAKAELYFFRKKRNLYEKLTEQMSNVAFLLVFAEDATSKGFSQETIDQIFSPLRAEFLKISKIAEIQASLFKGFLTTEELHPTYRIATRKIKMSINKIYKKHRKTREHLYNTHQLAHYIVEMMRFNAILFTVSSLLEEWQKMIELVEKKKTDPIMPVVN